MKTKATPDPLAEPGDIVLSLGSRRHAVVMQPDPDSPCLAVGIFYRGELVRVVDEPAEVQQLIERATAVEAQLDDLELRRQAQRRARRLAAREAAARQS